MSSRFCHELEDRLVRYARIDTQSDEFHRPRPAQRSSTIC